LYDLIEITHCNRRFLQDCHVNDYGLAFFCRASLMMLL
jgi:hypothetical protein